MKTSVGTFDEINRKQKALNMTTYIHDILVATSPY